MQTTIINEAPKVEEGWTVCRWFSEYPSSSELMANIVADELAAVNARCFSGPDPDMCLMCNKRHTTSKEHEKRLLEEAINFRLSGAPINPLSFRRFSGGACSGFAGKLTKANIMGFWGIGIDQLGIRGKQIHETTQKIKYGSKFLVPAEVEAYEVHLVSYSGQGKYDRSTRCVPWHAIPDGNTDGSDDKSSTDGNMPDLPAGHMWWPTVRLRTSGAPDSDPWGIFVCYIQWGYSIPEAWLLTLDFVA